jgi:hypothetical protein
MKNDTNNNTNNNTYNDTDYICMNIKCVTELIDHIKEKKRKLDLYRKILELKYNRYKKCHNFWNISTILLSTSLTVIESCKLIFLDKDSLDRSIHDFFDLSPILLGSIITCTSSIIKFKKYQEKMEVYSNTIEKCINMIAKLKNKRELLELQNNCGKDNISKDTLKKYYDEILTEYSIIYQESQKYIKNTDYDKYSKILNYSEINKYMIEQDRLQFYKIYKPDTDIETLTKKSKKCYKQKLCCLP